MSLIATGTPDPPKDPYKGRPIGRILTKLGKLTREQVHQGLAVQADAKAKKKTHPQLGEILIDLGLCTRDDIALALHLQRGSPPPQP